MATKIYNFFSFLEKKAGKTLPPDKAFLLKLQHAKELVSKKDADDLSFDLQLVYFPEMFDDANLTITNNDYRTPKNTTALPKNFTIVGGTLTVTYLTEQPINLKAESVNWLVSSDLFPESFNGATFKRFEVYKGCNKLPENIKVTQDLDIGGSQVETLPEGLETESVKVMASKLVSLPSRLTCNKLDIRNTGITEIPEGVIVKEKLSVTEIPLKFPKHVEDVIALNGFVTIKQKKAFEALPEISAKVGKKVKKGKGMQIPVPELDEEKFTNFIDIYKTYTTADDYRRRIKGLSENAGKFFNAKFDTLYFYYNMTPTGFDASWYLYGKDNKNREILINPESVISTEGQVSLKSISIADPTERQLVSTLAKLFPKSYEGEKPVKAVNIRTLMTGPQSKNEYWKIGRKQRGGYGITAKAKDLIPSLSAVSQDNMQQYAKRHNVTWGDMMVFANHDAINIIARSNEKTQDGEYVYFDKYGYGQGGGSTVFKAPDYTKL